MEDKVEIMRFDDAQSSSDYRENIINESMRSGIQEMDSENEQSMPKSRLH